MRTRFRGITVREVVLIEGAAGWGEWSPFLEYDAPVAAPWLALRRGGRGRRLAGAVARPRTGQRHRARGRPEQAHADRRAGRLPHRQGQGRRARPEPRRRPGPARGGPRRARPDGRSASTPTACGPSSRPSTRSPCSTAPPAASSTSSSRAPSVEDLAAVRRAVDVPIAADESIRRAADPYRVRDLEAADIAVLKVQPLGGVRACLGSPRTSACRWWSPQPWRRSVGIAAGRRAGRRAARAAATPAGWRPCSCSPTTSRRAAAAGRRRLPVGAPGRPRRARPRWPPTPDRVAHWEPGWREVRATEDEP